MAHDDDRPPFALLEDLAKVVHELLIFDLAETRRVSRKLGQRLCQLGAGAIQVTVPEMVQANGSLDQSLVEKPGGTLGHPPEVFPGLVSLEVAAGVEKIYSLTQEIAHQPGPPKLLRRKVKMTEIAHGKTLNLTSYREAHQLDSPTPARAGTLCLQSRRQLVIIGAEAHATP